MLTFLVYVFTIMILFIVALPQILCFLLKHFLKLDILTIKMYTFTHYKSFFLKIPINNKIWSISEIIVSIPDIKIKLNIKLFKIIIEMENL